MSIIRYTKEDNIPYAYLNIFPDQFKTEKQKEDDNWIKNTMDYFGNKAYSDYNRNKNTFVKNYDLVKGILRSADFYEDEPVVKSFVDMLTKDLDLPSFVKHYSIMTAPLNELSGELAKRPDEYRVKAFDDDSKSEELEFKTDILNQYIIANAKNQILEKAALEGVELEDEQVETLTLDKIKDEIDNYTSIAEKWGNKVLTCMKADFNIKELSEEAFKDLQICAREYFLIDEDNSNIGFNLETLNPKNVWFLSTPDRKYTSDPSGRAKGAYAAGTVNVMEISEIIESFPEITKEEIDHLRKALQDYGLINVRESNLFSNPTPGIGSIKYDVYDPLVLEQRMILESDMKGNEDSLGDFLGLTSNVSAFGYKYVVIRAYWMSKKKIGKLVYLDELNNEQSILVDETYKKGTHPFEISIEWGWINQWYRGLKIGPDIYHAKPFRLLTYCPIIGVNYEIKNTEARSLVDMMKPFQVIYNVAVNQLFELLKKEIGNIGTINIRRIPKLKDGDDQDALDMWELEARERGINFEDDSPENTKAPMSNTTVAKSVDLTRTNEMQSRISLATWAKNECWELVGFSRQRLGSTSPSESATGVQAALAQSYNQTEPWFVAHEYVLGQVYQAILDASLYTQSQKPTSTISYITNQGESAFIQVNGADIKLRQLKTFPTNRPEDKKLFEEIRLLAQPLLQNGGSFSDVIHLFSTDSVRQMKKVFKELEEKQDQYRNAELQQGQNELQQNQEIAEAQLNQAAIQHKQTITNENFNKELDRQSKEKIAVIQSLGFGKVKGEDLDNDQIYDVLEMSKLTDEKDKTIKEYNIKMADIQSKSKQASDKNALEKEKLKVERDNMKNDLQIAKIQAKSKNKLAPKKKKK